MKTLTVCGAVLVLMVSCSGTEERDVQAALESLVAVEKAFDAKASAEGISPAFRHFLADNGVLFRPGPKNGKEIYERHPVVAGVLTWQPRFVEVSTALDLGYTTGPWKFWRDSTRTGFPGNGEYVSIWRRQPDDSWKLEVDIGIEHVPHAWDSAVVLHRNSEPVAVTALTTDELAATKQTLLERDRAFSAASKTNGKTAAADEFFSTPFNCLHVGELPTSDRQRTHEMLERYIDDLVWEPDSVGMAVSGDLGYTYGVMMHKSAFYEDAPVEYFSYLHIWRKEADSRWKVALQLVASLPPPEPAGGE